MQWGYVYKTTYMLHKIVFPIRFPHKCFNFIVSLDAKNNLRHNYSGELEGSWLVHAYGQPTNDYAYVVFADSDSESLQGARYTENTQMGEDKRSSFSWIAIGY